ncbi:aminotransferase class I/II-fold pyridoxal phosphate-dependent enzyme [Roseovarius atlanticus]|uniref:aminotransferase class I/II-fold pyridoxal phosphate-dependent enzyme n=1 Tax=Roseovarius atlanticus TaxID=1641875 RepID=UPI001C9516AF|nr:aminotransferase class I/II-fold pyridoxal phosphate-dependent enzyme [Roseovarius atlanticus]MBY5986720.1 aminotransferase class I/II-fold pyridoxal phosphate-dependent enzyme [Roseovarius atlanticus]MBY6125360.1 aminotransferase class I/II-fold pyridoxal phosphate-dependent enzyme [Roseovarius atlanticus]MBY6150179.1 aminotransferase class I/II-fold pyridoxal phosphate-dependent enzyme [Roseovarius atlanticus]
MMFPERFSNLPEYAFPRLRTLLDVHDPGGHVIHMTIGEPQHDFPGWIMDVIERHAEEFRKYPVNEGIPALNTAFCDWVSRRYGVELSPDRHVMALNGTREGLYNAMMTLSPETKNGKQPIVLLPNPFYQVYMVAALSVGAEPMFLPATRETGFLPDFASLDADVLDRVTVAYLCSPSNPQGAVADAAYWKALIGLAEKHDFKVFADECYSEIYRDAPPVGALEVAKEMGADPERVVAFHSLSKRSNLAGLRSGFVASGPQSMKRIRQLRSYAGTPLPLPLQHAAAKVWADEKHVEVNRGLYREKYKLADEIFDGVPGYQSPEAGFFLWLPVEDGETAALKLWKETGVRVLPGAYLAQEAGGLNPGHAYIRVAMVAPKKEVARGLTQLRDCLYN